MQRVRIGAHRGSHLPVLIKLALMTTGPILELGVGFCSSPFLHWACYPTKRRIVSYENNPSFFDYAKTWESDFHEVHCIDDWDKVDLSENWGVAFVDHQPGPRRGIETLRLKHADYIVIHDSENSANRDYHLLEIRHQFKYRYKYTDAKPYTSVWSNCHDLSEFKI